jgi:hypothetical protein
MRNQVARHLTRELTDGMGPHAVGDEKDVTPLSPGPDVGGAHGCETILIVRPTHPGVRDGCVDDDVFPVHSLTLPTAYDLAMIDPEAFASALLGRCRDMKIAGESPPLQASTVRLAMKDRSDLILRREEASQSRSHVGLYRPSVAKESVLPEFFDSRAARKDDVASSLWF